MESNDRLLIWSLILSIISLGNSVNLDLVCDECSCANDCVCGQCTTHECDVFGGLCCCQRHNHSVTEDAVGSLPGIDTTTAGLYSGYLAVGPHRMFYWLSEAQHSPASAPVLFFFVGGPGDSVMELLFTQLGPFIVDNKGLKHNLWSFNQFAHLVVIDSPSGVGFSYAVDAKDEWDDQQVCELNVASISLFFDRHKRLANNDLYLGGHSYAGLLLPKMSIVIQHKYPHLDRNLKGIVLGNAVIDTDVIMDTQVALLYEHTVIDSKLYDGLKLACCAETELDSDNCRYSSHLIRHKRRTRGLTTLYSSDGTNCGDLMDALTNSIRYKNVNSVFNMYRQCVNTSHLQQIITKLGTHPDHKTSELFNSEYSCSAKSLVTEFLHKTSVLNSLHISEYWQTHNTWTPQSDSVFNNYEGDFVTSVEDLLYLLDTKPSLRILYYNGDVDSVCTFAAAHRSLTQIALTANLKVSDRVNWSFAGQLAGTVQQFGDRLSLASIKVGIGDQNLEVRLIEKSLNGGHYAPIDQPGAVFQLLYNFLLDRPLLTEL